MRILSICAIFIPLVGGILLAVFKFLSEKAVSIICNVLLTLTLLSSIILVGSFFAVGKSVSLDFGALYQQHSYSFPLVLIIDGPACIYLLLTTVLACITVKYSRYYLHREKGYRRYFSLILIMVGGSNLLALSGTLDLLFAGWELIALSSFLLISFYWNRKQPARNAFLAFVIYRICDMGLLASTMLTHVLWTDGDRFLDLANNASRVLAHAEAIHPWGLLSIAALLLFASLGKSAQLPFLNWLPRALEGPTPSSAIFYGALSVHAGVFLLLRTEPIWSHYLFIRILIGIIGLMSAMIATLIGRTLANIKGQIAYAAIAQVGVIFIEIALDLRFLALVHLVLHSCLRAYQILISPSIVSHALRVLGSSVQPPVSLTHRVLSIPEKFFSRYQIALYRLSLADFYLWPSRTTSLPMSHYFHRLISATLGRSVGSAWTRIGVCSLIAAIGCITLDPSTAFSIVIIHYSLICGVWFIGWMALASKRNLSLSHYHGLLATSPYSAVLVLLAVLVITGMPLSPSFFSEDFLLHWSFEHSPAASVVLAISITVVSIASARVFTRLYFGRHHDY